MNFFGATRLSKPLPPLPVTAAAPPKKSAAAAAARPAHTKKRPRPEADALFAADSGEEEEEEEEAAAASAASYRGRAPSAATAARASQPQSDEADPSRPKKKSRNAPEELSSKKRVASGVIVTALPKTNVEKKRRDPRFDPLCGDYDSHHFNSHYSWMNDAKSGEINEWQAELRSGKREKRPLTEEEREELRSNINRAKQSIASTKRTTSESALLREWKHSERLAQKDGKKPFFLKKSEQKKLALAARYMELKENKGALQKFMLKKTRDVTNKDHKYMPREGRE